MQTLNARIATVDARRTPGPASEARRVHVPVTSAIGEQVYRALAGLLPRDVTFATSDASVRDAAAREGDLLVAAIDHCLPRSFASLAGSHRARALYVHVHGGEAVIGPAVSPGRPGCLQCWTTRYYAGRPDARRWMLGMVAEEQDAPDPWLTPQALAIIGQIAAARAVALLREDSSAAAGMSAAARAGGDFGEAMAVYALDLRTLTGRWTRVLPDPLCARCGHRPLDTPDAARLPLRARPKPRPEDDRLRDVREFAPALAATYVSDHAGLVREVKQLSRMTHIAVATTQAPLTNYTGVSRLVPCSGFGERYGLSRAVAVLEGLERYASTRPRRCRFAVHDSLASLGAIAVEPRRFGWYGEAEYEANAHWLRRFDERLAVDFVWGYSFRQQRPVLLPAQLVYYMEPSGGDPIYAIDSSVGCAMGSAPEEAMLQGVLEVIERDAFLLAWYAQSALPRFDVTACADPEVRAHDRRLRAEGYDVVALDATTDYGIPAVIVVARRRDAVIPHASCIAAAHHRPDQALRKAFRELIPGLRRYGREVNEDKLAYTHGLHEDWRRVRTMEDHAYLYCLPEAGYALDFLTNVAGRTSLEALRERGRACCAPDLTEELRAVAARVLAVAPDLFAIDQTAPELRAVGLHCFKMMIPGAVPMAWGQHLRRLEGLPRLDRARGDTPLNPAPHAFP